MTTSAACDCRLNATAVPTIPMASRFAVRLPRTLTTRNVASAMLSVLNA